MMIFQRNILEYWLIVQSNIAFAMALGLLSFCIYTFGETPLKFSMNTSFCTEVSLKNEFLNFFRFHAGGCFLSDSVHDRQLSLSAHYVSPAHRRVHPSLQSYRMVLVKRWVNFVPLWRYERTLLFWSSFLMSIFFIFVGAMCTIDRSFGPVLDHTLHHISDTHVCHHLFSKMPFYHAQEATEHIRKVLGPYYMKDETPLIRALYRSYSACQFVEDDGDIVFYKNIK